MTTATAEMNRAHRALDRAEEAYEYARIAYMEGIDRDGTRMAAARASMADAEEAVLSLVNAIYF
jgi:hypothetical protein